MKILSSPKKIKQEKIWVKKKKKTQLSAFQAGLLHIEQHFKESYKRIHC